MHNGQSKTASSLQRDDIIRVMADGNYRTLAEIQRDVEKQFGRRHPETSISAALRWIDTHSEYDWRKEKHHNGNGLWSYRLYPWKVREVQGSLF